MNSNVSNIVANINQYIFSHHKIGIDLGSFNTRISLQSRGVILNEPSFIGFNNRTRQYLFFGREAKDIYGKAPQFIKVIKPISNAIIADFDGVVEMIKVYLTKSVSPYYPKTIIKPRLYAYTTTPTNATEVEQRAAEESLYKAGFTGVRIIEKPLAVAAGTNQSILSKKPIFVLDIGAGIVEMAVIIMGGIVSSKTINTAGEYMDRALISYLNLKYGLIIGPQTAEKLKVELFSYLDQKKTMLVRGKSLENGLPKTIKVTTNDVKEALSPVINHISDGLKEFIETIPPETVDSVIKNGIVLSGALAIIGGLDKYLSHEIKIPITTAAKPEMVTINGITELLTNEHLYKDFFIK